MVAVGCAVERFAIRTSSAFADLSRRGAHRATVFCGNWPRENCSGLRGRRSISEKLRNTKLNHSAQIRLDTMLENCIFYISPMYEFSRSQGQTRTSADVWGTTASPSEDGVIGRPACG